MDLQEATRRDDVYNDVMEVINKVSGIPVGLPLVWVWAWDVVCQWYKTENYDYVFKELPAETAVYVDEYFPKGLDLKTIWNKFWADADKNGFSLEFGAESLDEHLRDWLRDNDFLVDMNLIDEDV